MWTANIKDITKDLEAEVARVTIEYKNGEKTKIVTERVSDPSSIQKIAKDGVNELNRIDEINNLVTNKANVIGVVDFQPPVFSKEESDKQIYQTKRQELKLMKEDFDLGLVSKEEYDLKLNEVKLLK